MCVLTTSQVILVLVKGYSDYRTPNFVGFYQNYFWEEAAMKILQKTKPMGFDPEAQKNPLSLCHAGKNLYLNLQRTTVYR